MNVEHDGRRVYYSRPRVVMLALAAAFVLLVMAVALPQGIATAHNTTNVVIGSVLFAAALITIARLIRCVVVADDAGLTVRNPLRTYRVAWRDVYGVSAGSFTTSGGLSNGRIVQIELSP